MPDLQEKLRGAAERAEWGPWCFWEEAGALGKNVGVNHWKQAGGMLWAAGVSPAFLSRITGAPFREGGPFLQVGPWQSLFLERDREGTRCFQNVP